MFFQVPQNTFPFQVTHNTPLDHFSVSKETKTKYIIHIHYHEKKYTHFKLSIIKLY